MVLAHDGSEKTIDVRGKSELSEETYEDTNFPLYISIETPDKNTYKYKCIGLENGYPVYVTPNKDSNNNEYILVKNSNNKYVLHQVNEDFSGWSEKDTQC